ncbi:MAG: DCC1-like thiol-disulfide oxidoreductase family protein [Verrucomicrobiota bacterium]
MPTLPSHSPAEDALEPGADAIVLFDGECGLCQGSVNWMLARDRQRTLRYAPLQGETARAILERHGKDPTVLSGMWLCEYPHTPRERLLHRSDAALASLRHLGGFWRVLSWARFIPSALRNWVYGIIARNRYKWFGKKEAGSACSLGTPEQRKMILP